MSQPTGPFFENMPADLLRELHRTGSLRTFGPGETLFYEEDRADQLFAIVEGRVRVWRTSPRGAAMTVHLLGPGDLPGAAAVFGGITYPATATAITDVRTLGWPVERAQSMVHENTWLASSIIRIIAHRNEEMLQRLHEVSTQPVEQRVARTLLRIAPEPANFTPATRQELAELSATTLHTVSRIVSRWEADGLVDAGRRRIHIADRHGLAERADPAGG